MGSKHHVAFNKTTGCLCVVFLQNSSLAVWKSSSDIFFPNLQFIFFLRILGLTKKSRDRSPNWPQSENHLTKTTLSRSFQDISPPKNLMEAEPLGLAAVHDLENEQNRCRWIFWQFQLVPTSHGLASEEGRENSSAWRNALLTLKIWTLGFL